jgi:hypothetical protein
LIIIITCVLSNAKVQFNDNASRITQLLILRKLHINRIYYNFFFFWTKWFVSLLLFEDFTMAKFILWALPSGRWVKHFGTYRGCSFLRVCLYYRQFTELKAVSGGNTRPQDLIWGSVQS